MQTAKRTISEVTRRHIMDYLTIASIPWYGRLSEVDFLQRLYNLKDLPSTDHRFQDAEGDIYQHCINNFDWEIDWVFNDDRFELLEGPDDVFLNFLCQLVHPVVRPDSEMAKTIVAHFNDFLVEDNWEIYECTQISGQPVYAAQRTLNGVSLPLGSAQQLVADLSSFVSKEVTKLQSAVNTDPELAISTAKDLLETVCKTILDERGVSYSSGEQTTGLVRKACKSLGLAPDDISDAAKAADKIKILLSHFSSIAQIMAELRNLYGSGHGKPASFKGLSSRHARLAANASSTLAVFLLETHQEKP